MTAQEALDYFIRRKAQLGISDKIQQAETLAISAIKKQIPKKPIEKDIGKLKIPDTAFCPTCGNPVIKDEADNYEQAFCCYCGQAIGWSVKKKF